jgi:hypothetical protein
VAENSDVNDSFSAHEILVRCAWCERIKVDDAWIEVAEVQAMQFIPETVGQHSHGICPDCFTQLTPPDS